MPDLRPRSSSSFRPSNPLDPGIAFGVSLYACKCALHTLTGAYNIVSLNGATTVTQTYDWSGTLFDWSNPFRVGDGSEALPNGGGNYVFTSDADATGLGLVGGTHNRLTVDLSALGDLSGALFHFMIECGNDGINGHNSVPDGGTALSLFGLGMGAFGFRRRRLN